MRLAGGDEGIEHAQGVVRGNDQLVAEVAGEPGAAEGDRGIGDLGLDEVEVAQPRDVVGELLEDRPRARALDRE